jgi:hypothetical protein
MASSIRTRFGRAYVNFLADAARVYRSKSTSSERSTRTSHRVPAKHNIGRQAGSSSHCFGALRKASKSAWAAPGVADEQTSKDIRAGSGSTAPSTAAETRGALIWSTLDRAAGFEDEHARLAATPLFPSDERRVTSVAGPAGCSASAPGRPPAEAEAPGSWPPGRQCGSRRNPAPPDRPSAPSRTTERAVPDDRGAQASTAPALDCPS